MARREPPAVRDRVEAVAATLPGAERRVAEAVVSDPHLVAFGTVASLAERTGTSGPTVLRFAGRLGYRGFRGLQTAVQEELAGRLRPASERIREPGARDLPARTATTDTGNVERSVAGIDRTELARAVALLADRDRAVFVLTGELTRAVGVLLADRLDLLRPGVQRIAGGPVQIARALAGIRRGDVVITVDTRRYERWLVAALDRAAGAGAVVVAVTDSRLSPLSHPGGVTLAVTVESPGPFESLVGPVAVAQVMTNAVARRLRTTASRRLDAVEQAWADELVDP